MRMWAAPVQIMCRQHLLGEHVEMHMFVGHLHDGKRLGGYSHLCETDRIQERHDTLAAEMVARGYRHNSPLQYNDTLHQGRLDDDSLQQLLDRCDECRLRHARTVQQGA